MTRQNKDIDIKGMLFVIFLLCTMIVILFYETESSRKENTDLKEQCGLDECDNYEKELLEWGNNLEVFSLSDCGAITRAGLLNQSEFCSIWMGEIVNGSNNIEHLRRKCEVLP